MSVLSAYMHITYLPGACLDLKRVPSPLGLELEIVVNLHAGPGN